MIRPGKAIDAPALADLLSAACIASRYGGRVNVDMRMARKLFAQAAMKLGEAMYAAQQQPGDAETKPGTEGEDVLDADFEEVKDDKKNG